jgi:hypothetical protein
MNPELGPVAASPERRLSYLSGCGKGIFELVRKGKGMLTGRHRGLFYPDQSADSFAASWRNIGRVRNTLLLKGVTDASGD